MITIIICLYMIPIMCQLTTSTITFISATKMKEINSLITVTRVNNNTSSNSNWKLEWVLSNWVNEITVSNYLKSNRMRAWMFWTFKKWETRSRECFWKTKMKVCWIKMEWGRIRSLRASCLEIITRFHSNCPSIHSISLSTTIILAVVALMKMISQRWQRNNWIEMWVRKDYRRTNGDCYNQRRERSKRFFRISSQRRQEWTISAIFKELKRWDLINFSITCSRI